jgi:large subunit ribosomal protein L32
MAVPKKKKSKAKTRTRKSNNSKVAVRNVGTCSRCGAPKVSHRVCPHCGYYKNRQVLPVVEYE